MYAQLCKRLSEGAPNFEPPGSKITTFKRLLLINCRDEFENRAAVSATYERKTGILTGEEEEAKYIAKRKMLGNIKFIGELGKLEMLPDSTLHKCCEHLLVGRKKQPMAEQAEDLECLAHLFKTCGRIIDSPKARLLVDQYFQRINAVISNPDTPTRIKFLLQDVIDMRDNRWIPRKLANQDGPRPIQQVREDAARDGCIYLPQQELGPGGLPVGKGGSGMGDQHASRLEEALLSKSRGKGMEDIFGGPAPKGSNLLGTGPGVIGEGASDFGYDNMYGGGRNGHGHHHQSYQSYHHSSPYEDKYNSINNSYNNRDESSRDYKPKRDNYENKYAERPDFGDRFTANRNKTHPSNRGRGGNFGGGGAGGNGRSNGHNGGYNNSYNDYHNKNGGSHNNSNSSGGNSLMSSSTVDKDLPPRFKKMGGYGSSMNGGGSSMGGGQYNIGGSMNGSGGGSHYDNGGRGGGGGMNNSSSNNGDIQLRPANMMLKPKTPAILPKSARMDNGGVGGGVGTGGGSVQPNNGAMTMNVLEPVYISAKKMGGDKGKTGEKKNQGPTREEVFTRIEDVLAKLVETGSTNEAFTVWKEGEIPNKMVNNALIHMFKKVIKMEEEAKRKLAFQLADQLVTEDIITHIHCKEGLGRIIQALNSRPDTASEAGIVHLSTWCLTSEKLKLAELAEMTEGGCTHPLFLSILQKVAHGDEENTGSDLVLAMFKESGCQLLDQLPQEQRTEDHLGQLLEEKKLAFLVPMLSIKRELRKHLVEAKTIGPHQLQDWVLANVDEKHREEPSFVYALMDAVIRHVVEQTAENGGNNADNNTNTNEVEKELILRFKAVLKHFLRSSVQLQLSCIYALQVFCFHKGFPKGLMLRWFMALYEADIIEEHAFLKWKEDVNDTYPGKGKALFQVNQWLTWLEEAESEEDEDEE